MAYVSSGVEYALHCLLWLAGPDDLRPSAKDLADWQGVSQSFLAKIFARLEKANIVESTEGILGGYRLGRPAEAISVLDVMDAVDGRKPLFTCLEVRGRCAAFDGRPPAWATAGVCGIHAVMLHGEKVLRDEFAKVPLSALAAGFQSRRLPTEFPVVAKMWFRERRAAKASSRVDALRLQKATVKRASKKT